MLLIEWCDQSDIRWLITVKTKVIINLQDNHATSHFLTLSIEVQILCIKNEEKQTPYENYAAELLNLQKNTMENYLQFTVFIALSTYMKILCFTIYHDIRHPAFHL